MSCSRFSPLFRGLNLSQKEKFFFVSRSLNENSINNRIQEFDLKLDNLDVTNLIQETNRALTREKRSSSRFDYLSFRRKPYLLKNNSLNDLKLNNSSEIKSSTSNPLKGNNPIKLSNSITSSQQDDTSCSSNIVFNNFSSRKVAIMDFISFEKAALFSLYLVQSSDVQRSMYPIDILAFKVGNSTMSNPSLNRPFEITNRHWNVISTLMGLFDHQKEPLIFKNSSYVLLKNIYSQSLFCWSSEKFMTLIDSLLRNRLFYQLWLVVGFLSKCDYFNSHLFSQYIQTEIGKNGMDNENLVFYNLKLIKDMAYKLKMRNLNSIYELIMTSQLFGAIGGGTKESLRDILDYIYNSLLTVLSKSSAESVYETVLKDKYSQNIYYYNKTRTVSIGDYDALMLISRSTVRLKQILNIRAQNNVLWTERSSCAYLRSVLVIPNFDQALSKNVLLEKHPLAMMSFQKNKSDIGNNNSQVSFPIDGKLLVIRYCKGEHMLYLLSRFKHILESSTISISICNTAIYTGIQIIRKTPSEFKGEVKRIGEELLKAILVAMYSNRTANNSMKNIFDSEMHSPTSGEEHSWLIEPSRYTLKMLYQWLLIDCSKDLVTSLGFFTEKLLSLRVKEARLIIELFQKSSC